MNSRIVRTIIGWNVVLTLMLLISAAANVSSAQASFDPPVRVFTATPNLVGGGAGERTTDLTINAVAPQTIAEVQVTLPAAKQHMCFAFGSAEVEHQSGQGVYQFGLERNGFVPTATARRVELIDNPGTQDPKYKEVSTLYSWEGQTGNVTIGFTARKMSGADPDMKVTGATLSVICVKKVIG
jgi:hypothetical protein